MPQVSYVGSAALIARGVSALVPAVTDSAEDLVSKSQDNTPVDTGNLKAGQHVAEVKVSSTEVSAKVATGGESNEYAGYVHEGTSKMAARPFMAQALLDNAEVYKAAIAAAAAGAY